MLSGEDSTLSLTRGMVRKLAAILSTDVKEYSRLMGEDEEATVRTVTVYRAVIATLVQQYRGRVVDSPGDNLLAEFASVVDAVECAVAIQQELHTRNTELPVHRRMEFRIGINLGDVIVDEERIYGDGVNIAARLESLAEGGGICIAGSVYEQIKTKLALGYEDMGAQAVKNIAEPVRVYRVRTEPGVAAHLAVQRKPSAATSRLRGSLVTVALLALLGGGVSVWQLTSYPLSLSRMIPALQAPELPLPDKPSVAVLPFVNMSGDPEQEYFSDGMTEDLITELSRLAGLFVIARNSVFTYKGKAVKPDQVSRELGVRYMIEGSVRKANNRLRITAQLIDTTTGFHMWASRYDRDLQDIFAVQEDIARRITKELALRLTPEENKGMGLKYANNVEAWQYFMRGTELYRRYKKEDNVKARELFEKAISLDSQFVRAYANLAATHRQDWNLRWTQNSQTSEDLAYRMAQKAVELAKMERDPKPSLPYALQQWAYILLYKGRYQEASDAADEAVNLNENYADGYALGAQVLIYRGYPEEALRKTQKAVDLDPYPFHYDYHRGQAYYVWGFQTKTTNPTASWHYYQLASISLRTALRKNDDYRSARTYLVVVLWELGKQDEAVNEMDKLRQVGRPLARDIGEDVFREFVKMSHPYKNEEISKHLSDIWLAAERQLLQGSP
jgi:adenylate cyclase